MGRFLPWGLILMLLLFWDTSPAQDKAWQTEVLQKLNILENRINDLGNRLNEMDKRYEVRFTKIEERFNTVDERFNRLEDKIEAVNQRIDDKFNLIVFLLGFVVTLLALPYVPKLFERFRIRIERKEESQQVQELRQELQEQINQIKAQLAQRFGPMT